MPSSKSKPSQSKTNTNKEERLSPSEIAVLLLFDRIVFWMSDSFMLFDIPGFYADTALLIAAQSIRKETSVIQTDWP